jgi:hypothetical protein
MTVGANDLALCNFIEYLLDAPRRAVGPDVELLHSPNVVELHHVVRVLVAAVKARLLLRLSDRGP